MYVHNANTASIHACSQHQHYNTQTVYNMHTQYIHRSPCLLSHISTCVLAACNHRGAQLHILCACQALSVIWGGAETHHWMHRLAVSDYELVLVHHTALRQIMSDACYGHASGGTNRGSTVQEMENSGNKYTGRYLTLFKTTWWKRRLNFEINLPWMGPHFRNILILRNIS